MPAAARILLTVREARAAAVAESVCTRLGFSPSTVPTLPAADADLSATAALISGELPNDGVLRRLTALRRAVPALPIVLFPPARPGIMGLLPKVGTGSGLKVVGYWGDTSDGERLRACLEHLLASAPGAAVLRALGLLLPTGGPRRPIDIARAVIRLRARGERVTIATVASALGVAPRTLQRRWPAQIFSPHDFFGMITLIYALYTREWGGASWERIAHSLGMEPATLRALRRRWVPVGGEADELGRVVVMLAEQVDIRDRRAEEAPGVPPPHRDVAAAPGAHPPRAEPKLSRRPRTDPGS